MAAIELRNVTKKFATADGGTYTALKDLSLTVEEGQFCAVVGPTGCGKSTTLTLVSGLERPSQGEALVHGEPVTGIETGTGFVFQQDAVFPWRLGARQRRGRPDLPGQGRAEADEPGARLAPPRRPDRLRGPLPAPALRRHAQARRPGPDA